jgi:hypothetical protein
MNAYHRLYPAYNSQGARLIEMITGDVQAAIILRLDPFKAVEGMLVSRNCARDLQGAAFDTAPVRRHNREWRTRQTYMDAIIAPLSLM